MGADSGWLGRHLLENGGIFACGSAGYEGSAAEVATLPIVAIASMVTGMGYGLLDDHGHVYAYGDTSMEHPVGWN